MIESHQNALLRNILYCADYEQSDAILINSSPAPVSSELTIISVTVTFRQNTPYSKAVDTMFGVLIVIAVAWWLYATIRMLKKMRP